MPNPPPAQGPAKQPNPAKPAPDKPSDPIEGREPDPTRRPSEPTPKRPDDPYMKAEEEEPEISGE